MTKIPNYIHLWGSFRELEGRKRVGESVHARKGRY